MNILDKFKGLFKREKTFTADEWKKGLLIGGYAADTRAQNPFKDSSLVYVASSKISENLPQAPLLFYDIKTKTQLSLDSPVVRLFQRPNDNDSYFTYFEKSTLFLALYGETFWVMIDSAGQRMGTTTLPGAMQVLIPTRMKETIDDFGIVKYWTYDTGRERKEIPAEKILHIKFPNPYHPIRGMPPIQSARADVDSDYLAGRFSRSFFQNGANPGTVFTLPEDDESSDEQRKAFIKEWNQLHKGSSKQYKSAILNPGMDAKKVGLTQEEMDYVKQREFNAERILSVFGVPPPMAGFYEQATYGNVRTAKRIFWNETIKAYARRYESTLNNFFLPVYYPATICKFNFSDIDELKHDAKETAELVNIYANHGVPMNVLNDSFELPWEHQEGLDIGYQPMTMLEVGTNFIEAQREVSDANAADDDTKELVNVTPSIFNEFSKTFHDYLYGQRKKLLKYVAKDKNIDISFWKQENARLIGKFGQIYGKHGKDPLELTKINIFNKRMVDSIISGEKEEIPDRIRDLYNKFDKKLGKMKESRVDAISRQEVTQFMEQTNIGESNDD